MGEDELHIFDPDWTMAPAAILKAWMGEHDITLESLAAARPISVSAEAAQAMINEVLAKQPLSGLHAVVLDACTGVSEATWLNAERIYREGLAAGKKDVT